MSGTSPPTPSSPRQQVSKIPRRRPSSLLSSAVPPPASSAPACGPASPPRSGMHARGHARKSSRTHFADPPATVFAAPEDADEPSSGASLQERRWTSASGDETREVGRRTPSLSIYIPSTSSSSPSPLHHPQPNAQPSKSSLRRTSLPPHRSPASAAAHHPFAPHSRRSSATLAGSSASRTPRSARPPMMERTWSNTSRQTYTSFDLQAPRTPKEEREERELLAQQNRGLFGWLRRARRGDEESAPGERTALLGQGEQQTKWRYVAGEVWCYAKHILPPLLFFVGLVLVVALLAYWRAIERILTVPAKDVCDGSSTKRLAGLVCFALLSVLASACCNYMA
ncbi:hypothetical protein JCM10213v2_000955, partial [Rhodosporidiobolus nylandii]